MFEMTYVQRIAFNTASPLSQLFGSSPPNTLLLPLRATRPPAVSGALSRARLFTTSFCTEVLSKTPIASRISFGSTSLPYLIHHNIYFHWSQTGIVLPNGNVYPTEEKRI